MAAKGNSVWLVSGLKVKFRIHLAVEERWDAELVGEGDDNSDKRSEGAVVVGGMRVLIQQTRTEYL